MAVGIVVVAHSRALATAAVALAAEMLHGGDVRIEIAAGLDETTFGTDATRIHDAVVAADSGDGVVVLMDLGSAVLSAELALELLAPSLRERVVLSPAPLVEGLVVAAVSAASGAGRDQVAAEARDALLAKREHLGEPPPETPPAAAAAPADADAVTGSFTVTSPHGLHARPAARLVRIVEELHADVWLRNATRGSEWVPAGSLSRVAALGARPGHRIEVRATGPQALAAIMHLAAFAARAFDDPAFVSAPSVARPPQLTAGPPLPASPGIGIGPARHLDGAPPPMIEETAAAEPDRERERLADAVAAVRQEVEATRARVAREVGPGEAEIFDAHLALLDDPELRRDTLDRIRTGSSAPAAWSAAAGAVAAALDSLADPYLTARAADVRAVGNQVLRQLLGASAEPAPLTGPPGVVIAPDLTPAQAALLDPAAVTGLVLAFGSPTAHSAILARARGIPLVVAAGAGVLQIPAGTTVAVDGDSGELVVDPDDDALAAFRTRADEAARRTSAALTRASSPASTRDGVPVIVGANVGSVEDARLAAASGADVAGLVRTEFLFLGRESPPDAGEQAAAYRELAQALNGRRLVLRTLDVGGDKPLPYLPAPVEANPFLGVRGIRLSLALPELLTEQLVAMVEVAHETQVSVMFPMVTAVDEVVRARRLLAGAVTRVGRGEPPGLQVGIMVEVPAVALTAAAFAPLVDFVSIGTNDLTQYALAVERGNQALARLGDPLNPGVLHLVAAACRGAGGTPVAVCGEVAADERAAAVLVGLGVRELSVAPPAVPGVKDAIRRVSAAGAQSLAARALTATSADDVRALLGPHPTGAP
jgi:phosphoenolpyruvate-protein phosphotransferase/dihydroxyacetone kinase phosphotransfer subunit